MKASRLVTALCVIMITVPSSDSAHAFGREPHREITTYVANAAAFSNEDQKILKNAVLADDQGGWFYISSPHCDNADYLTTESNGGKDYYRSREYASAVLKSCVQFALSHFSIAVNMADLLVDSSGKEFSSQVDLESCKSKNEKEFIDQIDIAHSKCTILEALGRSWHTIEDFYAHSNYADAAENKKIGYDNPPGLRLVAPSAIFNMEDFFTDPNSHLYRDFENIVPVDLSTGCYPNDKDIYGDKNDDCKDNLHKRVKHDGTLAKDGPDSPRSEIIFEGKQTNYQRVFQQVKIEINKQWEYFKSVLSARYGSRGDAMIKAILK